MIRVRTHEADLLAIARALVTRDAYTTVDALLAGPVRLQQLGPTAMALLRQILGRGVVKVLAQLGGAHARRRPGHAGRVRVFDVRTPPALAFGPWTFEVLRWLTTAQLGAREPGLPFTMAPVKLGDQIVAYLILRLVQGRRLERAVASAPGLACPLTWLGFPRMLARHQAAAPGLLDLLDGADGRTLVECLELDLARRWAEPWPEDDLVPADIAGRMMTAERAVLADLVEGIARAERWDLAQVLVDAGVRALPPGLSARDIALRFVPRIVAEGPLRSRMEARQRSGALLHALERIGKKRDELGLVRFIDDDYDTAQTLLASWEILPREAPARAEAALALIGSLEPLG